MHVVDFSRNHWGEAGTLHPIDEARPKKAPGRIEHPGAWPKLFQLPSTLPHVRGLVRKLWDFAMWSDIRTTMNVYGNVVTNEMTTASSKVAGLAINGL